MTQGLIGNTDKRNAFFLLAGRLMASLGSGIFGFSLSLYVLDLTGSAGFFSMVLSFSVIPGILVNMFGGGLIDRMNKKKLIICADLLSAFFLMMFIFRFSIDPSNLVQIIVFAILNSFVQSFYALALTAAIPDMTSRENLPRLNSLIQMITTMLIIIGPVIGAICYKALGMKMILYIDVVCYLFSALMAAGISFYKVPKAAVTANYLDDMREAVTYLYHNKVLRFLMLICVLLNMIYLPMVMLVMPYINYQVIKISGFQLSLIEAAFGTGATLGGLYLSLRKDSKKLIKQLFSLLIVQAVLLFFWIFPVLPGFEYLSKTYITAVFCLIMGISGVVNMVQNVPVYTHFQLEIPENLRGKVLGFINVSAMIALPLGMWLCGLLLEATSWHYLIILASSLLTLICLISRRNKHFVNFAASFS